MCSGAVRGVHVSVLCESVFQCSPMCSGAVCGVHSPGVAPFLFQSCVSVYFNVLPCAVEQYVVCIAQVSPGSQTSGMAPGDDGLGNINPVFFNRLEPDAVLKSPSFGGGPQVGWCQLCGVFVFVSLVFLSLSLSLSFTSSVSFEPEAVLKSPSFGGWPQVGWCQLCSVFVFCLCVFIFVFVFFNNLEPDSVVKLLSFGGGPQAGWC